MEVASSGVKKGIIADTSLSWNAVLYEAEFGENFLEGLSRNKSSMSLSTYSGGGDAGSGDDGPGDAGSSIIGSQFFIWYPNLAMSSKHDCDVGLSASFPEENGALEITISFFVCPCFFVALGKAACFALYQTCS